MSGRQAIEPVRPFDPFELQDTILGDVRDPFPALADARRRGSVQPGGVELFSGEDDLDIDPGAPVFTVYSHDAVVRVLRDATTFSSSVVANVVGPVMGRTLLEMGGQEHRVHRALVSLAFRQKMLARWEQALVAVVVNDLIDQFVDAGQAELVRQFTFDFPVQVIARILGLPQSDYPRFQRWSIELLSVLVNWDRGIAASRALREYFGEELEERRRRPQDDLITDLSTAEIDGERLSDDEIFAFLRLLLPAGIETTYRSSGNLLYALLSHPQQLAAVGHDRSLIPQAIEEGLRWEPPILFLIRKTAHATELDGIPIPEGADINVCIGAANRDEGRYVEPDRFDISRDPHQHLTFGFGPHMCLGMHLARMETRVALANLLDRLPGLRLDPDADPPFVQGVAFRSPPALHVRFEGAA
jgi:cytochrome P450